MVRQSGEKEAVRCTEPVTQVGYDVKPGAQVRSAEGYFGSELSEHFCRVTG